MEVRQGGSASSSSVTTATSLTGVNGHLYLAAVSSKPYIAVSTVTGLGLTWTRVAAQCGGRNQTGIELWWAQGAATTGTVTATFVSPANRGDCGGAVFRRGRDEPGVTARVRQYKWRQWWVLRTARTALPTRST